MPLLTKKAEAQLRVFVVDGDISDHISYQFIAKQIALRGLTAKLWSQRMSHGGRKLKNIAW